MAGSNNYNIMLKILHFYLNNSLFITFLLWSLPNLQLIIKVANKNFHIASYFIFAAAVPAQISIITTFTTR
jgi:hypothetical protein